MKNNFVIAAFFVFAAILLASFTSSEIHQVEEFPEVAYPEGYRDWTHVKTYIVGPENPVFKFIGGFNHVYANDKAMQGYKTGYFPDGSVIVSDVIEAKEDSMDIREGSRHHIDVMMKDSLKYASWGGWGFEQFADNSNTKRLLTPQIRMICTNCHAKQKDFVFSEYRD